MSVFPKKLLTICGPTASGKTAIAIEICRQIGGEVISADSMQVYKGMDIGTAKPDAAEMSGIPHHLLSCVSPTERFAAPAFRENAQKAIVQICARGAVPVLCGGTGLYIDALTRPYGFSVHGDAALRARYESIAQEVDGKQRLHDMLAQVDPESAARLHLNDVRRVIRALEVYALTGHTLSDQMNADAQRKPECNALMYALDWPRDLLYARINARVERMMRDGLVSEVENLLSTGFSQDSTAMQAIGYKEIVQALRGDFPMERAVELIQQRSRNYAKRQMTWFRRDTRVEWIEPQGKTIKDISREILQSAVQRGLKLETER